VRQRIVLEVEVAQLHYSHATEYHRRVLVLALVLVLVLALALVLALVLARVLPAVVRQVLWR
jgi:hypothetical protein